MLNLLKEKPLSASDLALELKVTKPGISKIIKEVIKEGMIKICVHDDGVIRKGPKKVFYTLNSHAGMIGVIEFGSIYIHFHFVAIDGTKLFEWEIVNAEFIQPDHIERLYASFSQHAERLSKEGYRLLNIIISAPGRINKYTAEISNSFKFKDIQDIKLRAYFINAYHVPVYLHNDINLLLLGEQTAGAIGSSLEDAIVIFIDSGVGGAILNKGKVIEGEIGFAGEFGLVSTTDFEGKKSLIDLVCSTNTLKHVLGKQHFAEVVHDYTFDAKTKAIVNESAKRIGVLISDIYNILNITHFFIAGRINRLGHEYLEAVKGGLNGDAENISVAFAQLGEAATYYGALRVGISHGIRDLAQKIKHENQ